MSFDGAKRLGISFQSDKTIAAYRELSELVARYPFGTVSVYQDLFFQPPWPALQVLAEPRSEALVGPAVVNPYLSHPVLVAGHLAVLDELSGGRAFLGVGRGAFFESIGVAQPRPLRAIRECVQLVQRFLRGDESAFQGELFRADAGTRLRGPVPGRDLPVLVGGWGPETLALAGGVADMAKVGGSANPESVSVFRERIDRGSLAAGRRAGSTRLVLGAVTVVDRDSARAEALARRHVAMYVDVVSELEPTYRVPERELGAVREALARGDEDAAGAALSRETLDRCCVRGTPAEVIAHLERLFEAGVDAFELGTPHGADEAAAVRLLGDEVLPYFER